VVLEANDVRDFCDAESGIGEHLLGVFATRLIEHLLEADSRFVEAALQGSAAQTQAHSPP
jgi:hypothetical protein